MAIPQQCRKCGRAVQPPGKFCSECGTFISSEGTPTERTVPETERVKARPTTRVPPLQWPFWLTRTGLFLLLLFLCGGIAALWRLTQAANPGVEPPIVSQTMIPLTPPSLPTQEQPSGPAKNIPVHLEETAWNGGRDRFLVPNSDPKLYGGRTAMVIYGTSTTNNSMQTEFQVLSQPIGTPTLRIEGMDSEGPKKTHISIAVNGTEIYSGENPLPDDDMPLDTGNWGSYTWALDASLLRIGTNNITIRVLDEGEFRQPPWFMLDFAEVTYTTREN